MLILLVAAYVPSRLPRVARHPVLLGVIVWAHPIDGGAYFARRARR
jgi:uncharacterized membrane protein